MTGDEILEQLRAVFREEATENLEGLCEHLQALRANPEDSRKQRGEGAMRLAHNIKGAASSVGEDAISQLAHALEDVLEVIRDAPEAPPASILTAVGDALGTIQRCLHDPSAAADAEELTARLREFGGIPEQQVGAGFPSVRPEASAQAERPRPDGAPEVLAVAPRAPESEVRDVYPEPVATAEAPQVRRGTTLRVEARRLDELMRQTAELTIFRAEREQRLARFEALHEQLTALVESIPEALRDAGMDVRKEFEALQAGEAQDSHRLGRLGDALTAAVENVRLVPLTSLAPTWRRTVQDAANRLGKAVDLAVEASEIEVDKTILDALREPLIHVLRNAIDHGIEAPALRAAAGKPPRGQLKIAARVEQGTVRLEISDDGRGVDLTRIRAAALQRGRFPRDLLDRMSREELQQLIFEPGFSTRESVGEVSGRGVGLDVVRLGVEALGGWVLLAPSPRLGGTTIAISVPVRVVATRVLIVRTDAGLCAIPCDTIERTLRVPRQEIQRHQGAPVLPREDGPPAPAHWLAQSLGRTATRSAGTLSVVLLRRADLVIALVVDEVVEEREVVVRGLPWNLQGAPGVSGLAILPGQGVALVVDVAHLLRLEAPGATAQQSTPELGGGRRILVADDSVTARTLVGNALRTAGYQVTLVADGEQAWKTLASESFDLLVSDVEMPILDGLSLTRRVRATERFRGLPVVLVTSRGKAEEVSAGLQAGADEYVVKGRLQQERLLEAVARHL